MVYYHVWDNFPYPTFNKIWYDSTDVIVTISKLTSDIVRTVSPDVEEHYLPHTIPTNIFTKIEEDKVRAFRKDQLGLEKEDFLVFWNNRNARRKQSGSLIFWFYDFLKELKKKNPKAKAKLLMHTEPKDPNGQDLFAICGKLDTAQSKDVLISTDKLPAEGMSMLYNSADVTINVADAEGFGLATFESLSCETPIIVTMTGGLQEQVTKLNKVTEENMLKRNKKSDSIVEYEHGIGLEPSSKAIIGSQEVPFIYEDRLNGKQVSDALIMMYDYGSEKRKELGQAGRQHVLENYGFENFTKKWTEIMMKVHKKHGSWDTRKNYNRWELKAV
jgi:glycosyltransferase involved in cell wall biosynthesis